MCIRDRHTVLWEPDGEVRQLLLISHGMTEHILRYDPFARFLAEQGIAVIGHDHLGHGGTAVSYTHLDVYKRQGLDCIGEADGL